MVQPHDVCAAPPPLRKELLLLGGCSLTVLFLSILANFTYLDRTKHDLTAQQSHSPTQPRSTAIMADAEMPPSLKPIIDQKSLKWIFVGGKGGVGKTTTSCSLAVQMAKARKSVLLISTDPAHNLSDAFGMKFGKDARPVTGVPGLAAMEIDPNGSINDLINAGGDDAQEAMQGLGGVGSMFQDMAFSIPGVDEAMSFAEVLKQVKGMEYEVIIFDTAPTGHTLRFLQFPTTLEKALEKLSALSKQFGGMINNLVSARGGLPNGQSFDDVLKRMEDLQATIGDVNKQFKNADLTTYVLRLHASCALLIYNISVSSPC